MEEIIDFVTLEVLPAEVKTLQRECVLQLNKRFSHTVHMPLQHEARCMTGDQPGRNSSSVFYGHN